MTTLMIMTMLLLLMMTMIRMIQTLLGWLPPASERLHLHLLLLQVPNLP